MSTCTVSFCPTDLAKHTVRAAMAVALFAGLIMVAHCGSGCKDTVSPQEVLESSYAAAIMSCASTAGLPGPYDRAADLRCREQVNCAYKTSSCKDGGTNEPR